MQQRTIPQLFETSVQQFSNNIMMLEKNGTTYRGTTYREIRDAVYETACGLLSIGIKKGDRIALIAEGRNDWVISELAILYVGAINVPLSVKVNELSELKFRLAHSRCRMVIVSGSQAGKVQQLKNDLPDLEKIIHLDPQEHESDDEVSMRRVRELGKMYFEINAATFHQTWHSLNENDPANICYTSGTTADPKGIILTHRNYTANVEQATALLLFPA